MSSFFSRKSTNHGEGSLSKSSCKKTPKKKTLLEKTLFRSTSASTANTEESSSDSERGLCRDKEEKPQRCLVRASSLIRGSAMLHDGSSSIDLDQQQQHLQEDNEGEESVCLQDKDLTERQATKVTLAFTEKDSCGQSHPIETPELIAAKLVAFDEEVTTIPKNKRRALNQAIGKCPELLDGRFKLQFLRCEVFHEKRAAKRYVKYWERRLSVFGPEKAFLPLTQEAALKDDCVALSTGFFTLVGHKDSSGRSIIFGDPTRQDLSKYTTNSMIRAIWYMFHSALEDEDTQKRGLVFVSDLSNISFHMLDHELFRVVALSVAGCIPIRLSSIHGCHPTNLFWYLFPVVKLLLGEKLRKRVKLHSCTTSRLLLELAKYGIAEHAIPSELGGRAAIDHSKWLEDRRVLSL